MRLYGDENISTKDMKTMLSLISYFFLLVTCSGSSELSLRRENNEPAIMFGILMFDGGTVCGAGGFDDKAADLACREMGYKGATTWWHAYDLNFNLNNHSIPIGTANVMCNKNYESWWYCRYSSQIPTYCTHRNDVVLSCKDDIPEVAACDVQYYYNYSFSGIELYYKPYEGQQVDDCMSLCYMTEGCTHVAIILQQSVRFGNWCHVYGGDTQHDTITDPDIKVAYKKDCKKPVSVVTIALVSVVVVMFMVVVLICIVRHYKSRREKERACERAAAAGQTDLHRENQDQNVVVNNVDINLPPSDRGNEVNTDHRAPRQVHSGVELVSPRFQFPLAEVSSSSPAPASAPSSNLEEGGLAFPSGVETGNRAPPARIDFSNTAEISEECPPSYDLVMRNSQRYASE